MDGWYGLSEDQRFLKALGVRCPLCMVPPMRDCEAVASQPVGMLQRHVWLGDMSMHHQRETFAKQEYEVEQRDLAAQLESQRRIQEQQIERTCPWCGFLASSGEELTEHEAGCE